MCLRICAEDPGTCLRLRHRFVFGDSLWPQAYCSASGVCLDVRESIYRARMQPSEGKWRGSKTSREGYKKGLHPKGTYVGAVGSGVCFPFVSPGVIIGK